MEYQAKDRAAWRCWLEKNHANETEVWLVYFKKATGRPSISYADSVEEALCFGWIDGIRRRIDEERYAHRFTPRKTRSKWSPTNIKRALSLIDQEKMMPAGLDAFRRRVEYEHDQLRTDKQGPEALPKDIEKALRQHAIAWKNFCALAPGYKRQYVGWLSAAKRPETRVKRLSEAIALLSENKKPGMK